MKRSIFYLTFFVALLVFVGRILYVIWILEDTSIEVPSEWHESDYLAQNKSDERSAVLPVDNGLVESTSDEHDVDAFASGAFTEEEQAAINEWAESRGWSVSVLGEDGEPKAGYNAYADYSSESLKSLSEQGDGFAAQTLGERWLAEGGKDDEAIKMLEAAVVNGLTKPCFTLTEYYRNKVDLSAGKGPESAPIVDAYLWVRLGVQRKDGNLESLLAAIESRLTEQQLQVAESKFDSFYQDLLGQRRQQGLGDFDNNIPDVVERKQALSRAYRKKIGAY